MLGFGIEPSASRESLIHKLRKISIPKTFAGGYFGVRKVGKFTPSFREYVEGCEGFVDLTAGTGQFPVSLAADGIPVGVNDRCYYASVTLSCMFNRRWSNRPIEFWVDALDPSNVEGVEGYLFNHHRFLKSGKRIFSDEVARYLDGLCFDTNSDLVRYGVGRALVCFSFRGHHFCRKDGKGRGFEDYRVEEIYERVLRYVWKMILHARVLRNSTTEATYLDASDALDVLDVEGRLVYIDPAWPWAKKFGTTNPYKFFTNVISSVLLQDETDVPPWEIKGGPESIIDEVSGWIVKAFEKGARLFCACTQDTNYPDPDWVYSELDKRFSQRELMVIDDWSSAAGRVYQNYWGFYEPK